MKNIYDLREENNLYFLLPENGLIDRFLDFENTIVLVYLYYEDTLEKYFEYIDRIPYKIQIIIVTSNEITFEKLEKYSLHNKEKKIGLIKKENRGRDISALLVTCRELCLKYKYICFIHDKKNKAYIPEEDYKLWIENLWGNTLGSEYYIQNVLHLLESNDKIGLLVPPEPIGKYLNAWYMNAWGSDFKLTKQLAEELNLHCDLNIYKSPITLGTVFWAKSRALRKILEKEWIYDDFDEEPLKDDGTISHAIERILGYVAQDAGYDVGTVMNTSYAGKILSYTQKNFLTACQLIKNDYGFENIEEFSVKCRNLYRFCDESERIYLYGAGKIGKSCLHLLRALGFEPNGFIVSSMASKQKQEIEGLQINLLDNINHIDKVKIIITVNANLQFEIEDILKLRGIKNYIKYIGN